MNVPEAASEATDRGLGFQTIGFMIVGLGQRGDSGTGVRVGVLVVQFV